MANVKPWKPLRDPLRDLAGYLGEQTSQDPYTAYTGERVAPLDPLQQQYLSQAGLLGMDATQAGLGLIGSGADMTAGALGQAQNIFGQVAGGQAPTVDPLDLAYATTLATNPFMDSMIDAASRDVMRQFNEQAMPNIARDAWQRGDLDGSYRGIAEGIAQRGAQDAIYDISAGLRGSAYNQGLGIAADQASQNAAYENAFMQHQLGAGAGLGNVGQTAAGLVGQGVNAGVGGLNALNAAGGLAQGNAQMGLDMDYDTFLRNQNLPGMNVNFRVNPLATVGEAFGDSKNVNAGKGTFTQQMMQLGSQALGAWAMGGFPGLGGGTTPATPAGPSPNFGVNQVVSNPAVFNPGFGAGWGMPAPIAPIPSVPMAQTSDFQAYPYGMSPNPGFKW